MDATAASDPVSSLVVHHAAMHRLARALVFDEGLAADVAQDAARVALTRPVPAEWPVWAWLAGLVRNTARNALRAARRRQAHEHAAGVRSERTSEDPADAVARLEQHRRVLGAVARLPEPYRVVVVARYIDGRSLGDLADSSREPLETIRTRLRRALERLREDLGASTSSGRRALGCLLLVGGADCAPITVAEAVLPVVGEIAMKKVVVAVLAVLAACAGYSLWRLSELTAEVDRLASPPRPLAASPSDDLVHESRVADASSRPPPLLASAPATDAGVAARVAALETRIAALSKQLDEAQRARDEANGVVADLVAERIRVNETTVAAASRNVISGSAQFQMSSKCDVNGNGTGEYGGFLELSGGAAGRMSAPLNPPVLSGAFRTLTAAGEATRGGYLFRIFLPDSRGAGVGEPPSGFDRTMVDARLAETTWCLYAWPVAYGRTGTRTFFTNQGGDVLSTDAASYSGSGAGPAADAAFVERGSITGAAAIDTKAADGNVWKQVN